MVASCGTALTTQQVQASTAHARIVVNFDPDAAGRQRGRTLHQPAAGRRHAGPHRGTRRRARSRRVLQGARRRGLPGARSTAPRDISTGWPTARARKHDMRTSEGKVAVLKFLLPDGAEHLRPAGAHADRQRRRRAISASDQGMVLDHFKKAVADRNERAIAAAAEPSAPRRTHAAERSVDAMRKCARQILGRLRTLETIDTLPSRRIFQAIFALDDGGQPHRLRRAPRAAGGGRPEPAGQAVLNEDAKISHEEVGGSAWRACAAPNGSIVAVQLKARISEAERAGNWTRRCG